MWEKAGGYFENFSSSGIEDWDLWISFIELGYRAHVVPEIVWDYRIRPDQMSTAMYEPERWSRLFHQLVDRHADSYRSHAPEILSRQAFRWAELRAWANQCQRAAAWWESNSLAWQHKVQECSRMNMASQASLDASVPEKKWLEEQRAKYEQLAQERERSIAEKQIWIETLERDKGWLEEQRANWQSLAEVREAELAELQHWIETLEKDKTWLEEQRANWQCVAEEREKLLQSQNAWIRELETAKTWLETERTKWQALAEQKNRSGDEDETKD